jgi:hypothetical protein
MFKKKCGYCGITKESTNKNTNTNTNAKTNTNPNPNPNPNKKLNLPRLRPFFQKNP